MVFVKKNFIALSLDSNVEDLNKDIDQKYVKTLNLDVDKKDIVRGSARSVSLSNDLTCNGLKYHSLDSNIQKKMDNQNKYTEQKLNPKFTKKIESYFDGFSFYSQDKGYTLDEIVNNQKWCVSVPYGMVKGNTYVKTLKDALNYVYNTKCSDCKITNTFSNEIIGFGKYKPLTTIKYLDNKVNKTYQQNMEQKRIDNIVLTKEQIKQRNLEKMLKKD